MVSESETVQEKSGTKRKRSRNWTDDETKILIGVVRENYSDLRKTKRNEHVFLKIHEEATELDLDRTLQEIKTKWKSLASTLKTERAKLETGSSPSEWPFYEILSEFLGTIALNNHDSLETVASSSKKSNKRQREGSPGLSNLNTSSDNSLNSDLSDDKEPTGEKGVPATGNETFEVDQSGSGDEKSEDERPNLSKKRKIKTTKKKKSSYQLIEEEIRESKAASARLGDQMEKAFTALTPIIQGIGQTLNTVLPQLLMAPPSNGPFYPQNHGFGAHVAPPYNHHIPPNNAPQFNLNNQGYAAHNVLNQYYAAPNHVAYNEAPFVRPDRVPDNEIPPFYGNGAPQYYPQHHLSGQADDNQIQSGSNGHLH